MSEDPKDLNLDLSFLKGFSGVSGGEDFTGKKITPGLSADDTQATSWVAKVSATKDRTKY